MRTVCSSESGSASTLRLHALRAKLGDGDSERSDAPAFDHDSIDTYDWTRI